MATPENLISNPGFEEGISPWLQYIKDPLLAKIIWDDTDFNSGLRSIKIETLEAGTGSILQYISKEKLLEGATYRIRCVRKSIGNFSIFVYEWRAGEIVNKYRLIIPASAVWAETAWLEFTTPTGIDWENFASFQIVCGVSDNSIVSVDDFEMYSITPLPPPTTHSLSVATTPISGVPFTINIGGVPTSLVSPWNGTLEEGTYVITMPANIDNNKFVSWEDGSTDRTRTINLTAEMVITANLPLISNINGKVIDAKTEQPIIGALVECNGKQTSTDELGNSAFNNLSANIYTVLVSAAGYTGQTIEVDTSAGGVFTQDFSLTLSPLPLNKTALAVGAAFVVAVVTALIYIRLKKKS